jgi:zinc protease
MGDLLRGLGDVRDQTQLTVVDDVPVYWVDGEEDYAHAGLIFRVGSADERPQTHGISHLVEHMTLADIEDHTFDYNGTVTDTLTIFVAHGTPDEVAGFLGTVASRLLEPDMESIELHARVLRTEARSSSFDRIKGLHDLRFGYQGYGLRAQGELALHWVGPPDAQAWIERYFTAQNAAAWMTCPPPEGLRLRLPRGERMPPPAPRSLSMPFPAYAPWRSDEVAVSFLGDDSPATTAGLKILERALTRDLRHERGVSYTVGLLNMCLTPDMWHHILFADALPESALTVRDQMLSTMLRLERRGPEQSELDAFRQRVARNVERAEPVELVHYEAARRLAGEGFIPPREFSEACGSLTRDDVSAAMSRLAPSALLAYPVHLRPPAGWRTLDHLGRRVQGKTFKLAKGAKAADIGKALIVGPEGVSVVLENEEVLTVRFDECVCVGWDKERWRLLWNEIVRISVVPQLWKKGDEAVSMIDAALSPDIYVPLEGTAPSARVPRELRPPRRPDRP